MGKIQRYFAPEEDSEPFSSKKPSKVSKSPLQKIIKNVKSQKNVTGGTLESRPEVETVVASSKVIKKGWRNDTLPRKEKKWKTKKDKKAKRIILPENMTYDDKIRAAKAEEEKNPLDKPPLAKSTMDKYSRGKGLDNADKYIKSDFRRAKIVKKDEKVQAGLENAARSEIILLEEAGTIEVGEGEHTLQLQQYDVKKMVDLASAAKGFHLTLKEYGPYKLSYTTNGRYLLLGGKKGHIAAFDWVTKNLMCEMGVNESVHDVVWLHNENMFAVAQKEWTYIYDNQGIEIHCLKKMNRVTSLDFLPYHFLLAGGHESGFLSWVDVSIGKIVSQFNGRMGPINLMTTNPANAIVHCGHNKGTVSLWAPTVKKPLATILCHGCPVSALAVDGVGRLMATSARDGALRIWDLRNSYTPLTSVKVGTASSISFSQRGLLAMAIGNKSLIFSEVGHKQKPYLKHVAAGTINSLKFCPFEDVLGVGHQRGFDSLLIPGAGEPNFDAMERNPFQTKSQRREAEIKALLEKIQPELISLDNNILGEVDTTTLKSNIDSKPTYVKKADISLSHRKKRKNAKLPKIKEHLRTELNLKQAKEHEQNNKKRMDRNAKKVELPSDDPLARFNRKRI